MPSVGSILVNGQLVFTSYLQIIMVYQNVTADFNTYRCILLLTASQL